MRFPASPCPAPQEAGPSSLLLLSSLRLEGAGAIAPAARPGEGRARFKCCIRSWDLHSSTPTPTKSGEREQGVWLESPSQDPAVWPRSPLLCRSRAPAEEVAAVASGAAGGDDGGASGRPQPKAQPGHRSYNLQERRRIGSMTGAEQALLPRVPTDESEAQTLATADLDLMKSECWARAMPHAGGNGA